MNSKKHGVPQNRERVFIIGIRDDSDNFFTWPKEEHLTKKLKDILETDVDEKYFLSDKALKGLLNHKKENKEKGNGFGANISTEEEISHTIKARYYKDGSEQLIKNKKCRVRKLTPRECHRLQDFPDKHRLVCSDSQSYKQAGNSITVRVLELIIRKLNFK